MRELPLSRSVPAIRTIAALGLIACVNAPVVGFVQGRPELLPLVLAGVVALPIAAVLVVKLVERPQRGVLLLAALVPSDGLGEITSFPAGWKEALVLVTLAATFVAPRESRGVPGRRLPSWAYVVAAFFLLGAASALAVGGSQGLVGLKVGFFYVLIAVAVWRCPLDARERDRLVTILMAVGFVTAVFGIAQQVIGETQLVSWGYSYLVSGRTAGGAPGSFFLLVSKFPFPPSLLLVFVIATPFAIA